MSDSSARRMKAYRQEIVSSIEPVRPLPPPSRRVWMLVPPGLLLATMGPLVLGRRGDLDAYSPLLTWGATGLQSILGLWLLALGFREAVPGHNLSRRALILASILTGLLVIAITLLTNAASGSMSPVGRERQDWVECVVWPAGFGALFMIVATLMAVRAFPTRPAMPADFAGSPPEFFRMRDGGSVAGFPIPPTSSSRMVSQCWRWRPRDRWWPSSPMRRGGRDFRDLPARGMVLD